MEKVLKQQASELEHYVKAKHTQEECIGFIDGFERANELFALYSVVVPKGTLPYPYKHQLERIDQLNQTQTDLKQQLQILRHFGNKLGLYDASDYLKEK